MISKSFRPTHEQHSIEKAIADQDASAMKQGREDLARKALEHKLSHQQNATSLKTQIEQVTARIEDLKIDLLFMERTISEV